MKKYQIIYADPPWGGKGKFRGRGQVQFYETMDTQDIADLPIKDLTDSDCVLFLWCVLPMLPDALKVMSGWGFEYKTTAFVWVKRNCNQMGWFWGQGSWTRSNAELCLLGIKGHMVRQSAGIHQIVDTPIMAHSRKPDEVVRDRIVALCGDLPRIELFARRKVEGWDCWGNEVASDIEL